MQEGSGAERKRRRLVAEEERAVTSRAFSAYGLPLDMVTSFQYLGKVISAADDNSPAVFRNFSRASAVWKRITILLSREGADPRLSGFLFKAVVQVVFLFGAETWVVTPRMFIVLGEFQYQVVRRLTGRLPQRKTDGEWYYTLAETSREEVGFQTIEEYILRRHKTDVQYIATQLLLDLCEEEEVSSGAWVGIRWWEQADINLTGGY